jgi:LmbE family N-acetylglucosaminyl deacetylase
MVKYTKVILSRWGKPASILLLLTFITVATYFPSRVLAVVALNGLTPLSLEGYHRLLILAPHCDDETLGSGGLILAAQQAGLQVRVVIATNGDGFYFATARDFRKIYPHSQDYIRMGEMRQRESLAALAVLGVRADQVTFLSYPDRGTPGMWNDHWSANSPYRSPYNGDTHSPYPLTYNPTSVYAGQDYLADLISIVESYQPDIIVYPHPEDVHPDHWGLNVFTRLAIELIHRSDTAFRPMQYTYLVHRPDFPVIKGLKPQETLTPPPALFDIYPQWFRFDLTADAVVTKGKAVQQYRSQLPLLHKLLDSFVRQNELFAPIVSAQLPVIAEGNALDPSTWLDAAGQNVAPVQLDPVNDIFTHNVVPATDLVAVYAADDKKGNLLACSQVHEETSLEIIYAIRLKALTDAGVLSYSAETGKPQSGWHLAQRMGMYACISVSLADLGNPWAIYLSANSEGLDRISLDQSAWQMVYIQP